MKPPQEFIDEYWQFRQRKDWLDQGIRANDVSQTRMLVDDFLEFYGKWHPVIHIPQIRAMLEAARKPLERLRLDLERIYWAHLDEVVVAREEWLAAEAMFKAVVAITVLRREMPEHLRAEFEATLRDPETGASFDAENDFRETEKNAAEAEAEFRKALAGLAVDWPERVDAALRERLEKLESQGAKDWHSEIAAQQAGVGKKDQAKTSTRELPP